MIVKLSNKKYMQIEQFDTGLKGQEKVEKIVISPEENYNYKQVVRKYLNSIVKLQMFKWLPFIIGKYSFQYLNRTNCNCNWQYWNRFLPDWNSLDCMAAAFL